MMTNTYFEDLEASYYRTVLDHIIIQKSLNCAASFLFAKIVKSQFKISHYNSLMIYIYKVLHVCHA